MHTFTETDDIILDDEDFYSTGAIDALVLGNDGTPLVYELTLCIDGQSRLIKRFRIDQTGDQ